jgi:hypothetical protein
VSVFLEPGFETVRLLIEPAGLGEAAGLETES